MSFELKGNNFNTMYGLAIWLNFTRAIEATQCYWKNSQFTTTVYL